MAIISCMDRREWLDIVDRLSSQLETIEAWEPVASDLTALRCEQSRHRTLAHLRACQEQWLSVVTSFMERDSPSVKILHPWRQFDLQNYASLPWDDHMRKFIEDRHQWIALSDSVDWTRGGKWNQKPDSIGGLTGRLVNHESHHIGFFHYDVPDDAQPGKL